MQIVKNKSLIQRIRDRRTNQVVDYTFNSRRVPPERRAEPMTAYVAEDIGRVQAHVFEGLGICVTFLQGVFAVESEVWVRTWTLPGGRLGVLLVLPGGAVTAGEKVEIIEHRGRKSDHALPVMEQR